MGGSHRCAGDSRRSPTNKCPIAVVAPPGASAPSVAGGRGARRLHPRQVARLADVVCRGRPDGSRAEPVAEQQHLRSEEHTSELQSLMRNSYAVFCLKKKKDKKARIHTH